MLRRTILGVLGTSILALSALPCLVLYKPARPQSLPNGFDGDC